jgi:hypothetical protein
VRYEIDVLCARKASYALCAMLDVKWKYNAKDSRCYMLNMVKIKNAVQGGVWG